MDYKLWTPENQPDILGHPGSFANIEWGYNEIIENLWEIIRVKYPDYIKRQPLKYVQAFMGEESKYCRPDGRLKPIYSSFIAGYSKDFDVPGFVVEQNDYVFDNHLGTSKAMTLAVELFEYHIICEAERE